MSIEKELAIRSNNQCELCASTKKLSLYAVPPVTEIKISNCINTCETCLNQINKIEKAIPNYWRCLNHRIWSNIDAVKVVAYRMLHQLKHEVWPQDLLDMMYLEDDVLAWAKEGIEDDNTIFHKDTNGNILKSGDNIVITQTLNVKGSSLKAKKGTVVRKISLVKDKPEQIEGKIEGQKIIILTKFVRKQS